MLDAVAGWLMPHTPLALRPLSWLLDLVLQGTLLLLLAGGVSLLLRRASAASRHLVWLLALGGLLVLPLLSILMPRHLALMRSAPSSEAVSVRPQAATVPASPVESGRVEIYATPQPIVAQGPGAEVALGLDLLPEDAEPWGSESWAT